MDAPPYDDVNFIRNKASNKRYPPSNKTGSVHQTKSLDSQSLRQINQNFQRPIDKNFQRPIVQNFQRPIVQNHQKSFDQNHRRSFEERFQRSIDQNHQKSFDQNHQQSFEERLQRPIEERLQNRVNVGIIKRIFIYRNADSAFKPQLYFYRSKFCTEWEKFLEDLQKIAPPMRGGVVKHIFTLEGIQINSFDELEANGCDCRNSIFIFL